MNTKRTEYKIYQIMNAIYEADLPIVFIGAMVLKVVLDSNSSKYDRYTQDIDGEWTSKINNLDELTNYLNEAVKDLGNIRFVAYRNYGDKRSAGFEIYENEELLTMMDLSIRENTNSVLYSYGDIKFYGSSINRILADKILVLSSHKIFRRIKDLIDIYLLTSIVDINICEINKIIKESNRKLDDFSALKQKDNLKHAYNKFKTKATLPPFEDIYNKCLEISTKFK